MNSLIKRGMRNKITPKAINQYGCYVGCDEKGIHKKARNANLLTEEIACSCESNKVRNELVVNSVNQINLMTPINLENLSTEEVACSCKSNFVITIKFGNSQSCPNTAKVSQCYSSLD